MAERIGADRYLQAVEEFARLFVAIANSQVGYSANPAHSYCNKFSAYWDAGTADCPSDNTAEEWCADFAAWAWQKAGVKLTYGYVWGEITGGAISFYEWASPTVRGTPRQVATWLSLET